MVRQRSVLAIRSSGFERRARIQLLEPGKRNVSASVVTVTLPSRDHTATYTSKHQFKWVIQFAHPVVNTALFVMFAIFPCRLGATRSPSGKLRTPARESGRPSHPKQQIAKAAMNPLPPKARPSNDFHDQSTAIDNQFRLDSTRQICPRVSAPSAARPVDPGGRRVPRCPHRSAGTCRTR